MQCALLSSTIDREIATFGGLSLLYSAIMSDKQQVGGGKRLIILQRTILY
jgi:hypothetical protein